MTAYTTWSRDCLHNLIYRTLGCTYESGQFDCRKSGALQTVWWQTALQGPISLALFCGGYTILPQTNLTRCGSCWLAASKEPHAVLVILPQICRANRCSRSERKRINRTISYLSSILPQTTRQDYSRFSCGNLFLGAVRGHRCLAMNRVVRPRINDDEDLSPAKLWWAFDRLCSASLTAPPMFIFCITNNPYRYR